MRRPVGERRVAGEARRLREEVAQRHRRRRRERIAHAELGQVLRHWIVEPELARIAQLQDRRRGEELGDRPDAIERGGGGGPARLEVGEAVAVRPHQLLIVHDRDRETGSGAGGDLLVEPEIENREGVGDLGSVGEAGGRKRRRDGGEHQRRGQRESGAKRDGVAHCARCYCSRPRLHRLARRYGCVSLDSALGCAPFRL